MSLELGVSLAPRYQPPIRPERELRIEDSEMRVRVQYLFHG